MTTFTVPQEIALAIWPIPTGLVSLISSGAIIRMILSSEEKFNNPSKRIMFAISFYDIFQSLASAMSALPAPLNMRWGAIGNDSSCAVQGFLFQTGTLGSNLYSIALSFYFLCVIKFSINDRVFKDRFDIAIHSTITLITWVSSIYLLAVQNFNYTSGICWIAPAPLICINDPNVECIRGAKAYIYQWVFAGGPIFAAFFFHLVVTTILLRNLIALTRQMRRLSVWNTQQPTSNNVESSFPRRAMRRLSSMFSSTSQESLDNNINNSQNLASQHNMTTLMSPRRFYNRTYRREHMMKKNLQTQGLLYIASFLFVYLTSIIYRVTMQVSGKEYFALTLIARTINPLQGFFNVIIYTRTSVSRLRSTSKMSWFRAFYTVLKSDSTQNPSDSRGSSNPVSIELIRRHSSKTNSLLRQSIRNLDIAAPFDDADSSISQTNEKRETNNINNNENEMKSDPQLQEKELESLNYGIKWKENLDEDFKNHDKEIVRNNISFLKGKVSSYNNLYIDEDVGSRDNVVESGEDDVEIINRHDLDDDVGLSV